jgi:hypothetical protein
MNCVRSEKIREKLGTERKVEEVLRKLPGGLESACGPNGGLQVA